MHTNDKLSFCTVALCCCVRCAQTDRSVVWSSGNPLLSE